MFAHVVSCASNERVFLVHWNLADSQNKKKKKGEKEKRQDLGIGNNITNFFSKVLMFTFSLHKQRERELKTSHPPQTTALHRLRDLGPHQDAVPEHLDALIRDVARRRGHGREADLVVLLGPQHHVIVLVVDVGRQPVVGAAAAVAVDLAPVAAAAAARDVVSRLVSLAQDAHALAAPVVQRQHVGQARRDDADGRLHRQPHADGRESVRVVHRVVEQDDVVDSHQTRHANTSNC